MLLQESTRDLGEIAEIAEIMDITREILDGYEWETQLSYGLVILCNIVVIYHFGKIAVENLLQGGEAFVSETEDAIFLYDDDYSMAHYPFLHYRCFNDYSG